MSLILTPVGGGGVRGPKRENLSIFYLIIYYIFLSSLIWFKAQCLHFKNNATTKLFFQSRIRVWWILNRIISKTSPSFKLFHVIMFLTNSKNSSDRNYSLSPFPSRAWLKYRFNVEENHPYPEKKLRSYLFESHEKKRKGWADHGQPPFHTKKNYFYHATRVANPSSN